MKVCLLAAADFSKSPDVLRKALPMLQNDTMASSAAASPDKQEERQICKTMQCKALQMQCNTMQHNATQCCRVSSKGYIDAATAGI